MGDNGMLKHLVTKIVLEKTYLEGLESDRDLWEKHKDDPLVPNASEKYREYVQLCLQQKLIIESIQSQLSGLLA